jgi:hypothetical protein
VGLEFWALGSGMSVPTAQQFQALVHVSRISALSSCGLVLALGTIDQPDGTAAAAVAVGVAVTVTTSKVPAATAAVRVERTRRRDRVWLMSRYRRPSSGA